MSASGDISGSERSVPPPLDVAGLRALLASVAPLPWAFDEPGNWHGLSARIARAQEMGEIVGQVDLKGWGRKRGLAHAALIVAAVNALPALLDALEAREELLSDIGSFHGNALSDAFRARIYAALAPGRAAQGEAG